MHFLITNDDGIGALGILALKRAIAEFPEHHFTVLAPHRERSQCGHQVTTHELLEVKQIGSQHYTCSGSPADCVRLALFGLKLPITHVISGINAGGNMGQDLPISGTAAAAREATFHGLPALAMSHYLVRGRSVHWDLVSSWAHQIIRHVIDWSDLQKGEFYNLNFPHLENPTSLHPEIVPTKPTQAPLPATFSLESSKEEGVQQYRYTGNYSERIHESGSDVDICFGGKISLSKIQVF